MCPGSHAGWVHDMASNQADKSQACAVVAANDSEWYHRNNYVSTEILTLQDKTSSHGPCCDVDPKTTTQVHDFMAAAKSLQNPIFSSSNFTLELPLEGPPCSSRPSRMLALKQEQTTVAKICNLMLTLIQNELSIALLFLKHLRQLELWRSMRWVGANFLHGLNYSTSLDCNLVKTDHTDTVRLTRLSIHFMTYDGVDQTSH